MKALEDQLAKKLGDGVLKAAKQIFMVVLIFIFASAATATDPYFRKRLGERYFTPIRALMSFFAWSVVTSMTGYPYLSRHADPPARVAIIACFVSWSYVTMALIRLGGIRKRRFAGEIWHSRSRGESVFGSENALRDFAIEVVITGGLCFCSYYYAAFFALSRIMGYMADAAARAEFYNRYLDIQDAKIEAQYMETALREGLAPDHTLGIFNPLSRGFKGEHRANIARVVAAGQFGATSADDAPLVAKPVPATPQAPSAVVENTKKIAQRIASTLGSKRFLVLCAIVILAAGLVKGGIFLAHTAHVKWNRHMVSRPMAQTVVPVTPALRPEPAQVTVVAAATPKPTPAAVAPATVVGVPNQLVQPPPATTAVKVDADPVPIAPVTNTSSALEAKTIQPVELPKSAVAVAIDDLNTFSDYCETTITAANSQIAIIANPAIRAKFKAEYLQTQASIFQIVAHQRQYLETLKPNDPDSDASLTQAIPSFNLAREHATNTLTRFAAKIYNAGLRR